MISCDKEERQFLVNKDHFEILEWKKWADIKQGQIPFHPIIICKSLYIAKDNNGIRSMTRDSLKKSSEVLTLNMDIKGQDFQSDNCVDKKKLKPDKMEVMKRVTAENKNCKPAKQLVKFDQGIDKTKSSLNSSTHAAGGAVKASAFGFLKKIVKFTGNFFGKYDYSRLNSETTSNADKDLHSVTTEVEIPPNHSCTIEIKSRTSTVQSLCSGQLYRQYKNGEERTTFITGIYYQEERAELITSMIPCTPVTDGAKCCNA
ncbi:natterin-3 [Pimephales promelas]|uniref:natterin-3 n=1 Tax=Pimephales promelas TaxID=90988 RepID=UPI00195595D6|nr:natterin-3 [Pimephales promelas]